MLNTYDRLRSRGCDCDCDCSEPRLIQNNKKQQQRYKKIPVTSSISINPTKTITFVIMMSVLVLICKSNHVTQSFQLKSIYKKNSLFQQQKNIQFYHSHSKLSIQQQKTTKIKTKTISSTELNFSVRNSNNKNAIIHRHYHQQQRQQKQQQQQYAVSTTSTITTLTSHTQQQQQQQNEESLLSDAVSAAKKNTDNNQLENQTIILGTKMIKEETTTTTTTTNNYDNTITNTTNSILFDDTNWEQHESLNRTIYFRSWMVPVTDKTIQKILNSPTFVQQQLASYHEIIPSLKMGLKLIQNVPNQKLEEEEDEWNHDDKTILQSEKSKLILLHPDTPSIPNLPDCVLNFFHDTNIITMITDGPLVPISFTANDFIPSYILSQLLPKSIQPVPTSFETIGHVAHLNLKPKHVPYGILIGSILLKSLPSIETVIQKTGDVTGPYRTYPYEILAGKRNTTVEVRENGINLAFDMAHVYWCSRLNTERHRLLLNEFKPNQIIADAFCGVGALCLQAAKHLNCTIYANDWNQNAIDSLKQNILRNGVSDQFHRVQAGDAYDFLIDLGLQQKQQQQPIAVNIGTKVRRSRLPDHVIMNVPLEAPRFLGALRWWPAPPAVGKEEDDDFAPPRVHVYTFAKADKITHRSAEEVAVDLVATNLLPIIMPSATFTSAKVIESLKKGSTDEDHDNDNHHHIYDPTIRRLAELNDEYLCHVITHTVRDVSPEKIVVCVSFSATPKLLRHMQGDFR